MELLKKYVGIDVYNIINEYAKIILIKLNNSRHELLDHDDYKLLMYLDSINSECVEDFYIKKAPRYRYHFYKNINIYFIRNESPRDNRGFYITGLKVKPYSLNYTKIYNNIKHCFIKFNNLASNYDEYDVIPTLHPDIIDYILTFKPRYYTYELIPNNKSIKIQQISNNNLCNNKNTGLVECTKCNYHKVIVTTSDYDNRDYDNRDYRIDHYQNRYNDSDNDNSDDDNIYEESAKSNQQEQITELALDIYAQYMNKMRYTMEYIT